jgi:hypothetical protein
MMHNRRIGYHQARDRPQPRPMTHSPSHLLLTMVLSTGAGALMLRIGVQSKLIEWQSRRRRCPSSGRLRTGVCPHCSR